MNSNTISYSTPFNSDNGTAVKRKLEDDDYFIMSHKRLYKLNTQHHEQHKENTTLPIMAQTTSAIYPSFASNHNNNSNHNNDNNIRQDSNNSSSSNAILQQQGQVDMMDYDLTDEDESLQTPSSMNDFTVIEENEEDESDFIGDLEKGWVEMFSESSYYPYY